MKRRAVCVGIGVLAVGLVFTGAASAAGPGADGLQMYTGTVDRAMVGKLVQDGYDVAASKEVSGGVRIDLVLSGSDRARLAGRGIRLGLKRNKNGFTSQELAAQQAAFGFNVWRSWDEPGGIRDELYEIADQHPSLTKLEVVGHSIQGRAIVALKVTKNARRIPDGRRPAVLYSSNQHAREWISVEVNRRLLHYFLDNYGTDPQVTRLVNTRELWFVLSANPDGYQYTFTGDRLWRKNLHDNDGDGAITSIDGVDPNRNFDEHWRWDDEGSSSQFPSETFRGESMASEPETVAMQGLLQRIEPKFQVNYHSYGNLLLYSFGWQVQTPSADDPIFVALSGTDDNPAIPGFDPGVGADLYTTNGETTDYAHASADTLAWTPELGEGVTGNGFVFPDDEALIEAEFQKTLAFDLDVAKSAADPARPESHLGLTTKPFYLDVSEIDPQKRNNPLSDMRFSVSYGDPQPVQVLARRSLGAVSLRYQINGGRIYSAPTSEWDGGDRFGRPGDVYYRYLRGTVTGTQPGDVVTVWFVDANHRNVKSESFSYTAKVESQNRVLVLAAEDYSGISPVYANAAGPSYLSYYLDALQANGVTADTYDVDANGRNAPDDLGVLSHYDAVVWYTGDDVVTRDVGMAPGTASRVANDEMLNVRSYLNEGGRLLFAGKYAGFQYAFGYEFDPINGAACDPASAADGCFPLGDDFLQYYLGAYLYNDDAGTTPDGTIYDVLGVDTPFQGLNWTFGDPSANNQDHSASFIATSGILPAALYPQFTSWASAKYDRPGGPFEPHTGSYYMYSEIADVSYKRLTHTVDLTGSTTGNLSFWVSRNTEQDWDHVFVEAHTVGQDDWTTLPDLNGHTTTAPGESCKAGWRDLHPWLDHYQTWDGVETCTSTGTTGTWNAASGSSSGWEQWSVDLTAYAGKQVEISIAYVSDWSSQGLGVFVDDIVVSTGEGTTSFETGLDGWAVTGPPPGSAPNGNNWTRATAAGFPEGAAITTGPPDAAYRTIYLGFGLEGIATPEARNAVMGRVLSYLFG